MLCLAAGFLELNFLPCSQQPLLLSTVLAKRQQATLAKILTCVL